MGTCPGVAVIRVPSVYRTPIGAWVIWLCQGKCLALTASPDPHGRKQGHSDVGFPRHVGFTWELIYESGSLTPLKGCVVQGAVHPRCSRPSPVRFTAPVRLLAAHREELGLTD